MSSIKDEKDRRMTEEQSATIRLLTDLTRAGSWVINYAPDGLWHLYNGAMVSAG